jgi:hypothetical protein
MVDKRPLLEMASYSSSFSSYILYLVAKEGRRKVFGARVYAFENDEDFFQLL